MHRNAFIWLYLLLGGGCPTQSLPGNFLPTDGAFPADALLTQRAILTVRGRQFTLNGYLALSGTGAKRLIVMDSFSAVLADVLLKSDGTVHVMRSSRILRPAWIQRYVVADLQCVFGAGQDEPCQVRTLSARHFVIERSSYKLDLQIVRIEPALQPAGLFDETPTTAVP